MFMKVIKLEPQGYCGGVKNSIKIISDVLKKDYPKPIYLIGTLIHNKNVTNAIKNKGIIIVPEDKVWDEISSIKGTAIISADSLDLASINLLKNNGVNVIDATCPIVKKIHENIRSYLDKRAVLYIGNKDHFETKAVLKEDSSIILIKDEADIDKLDPNTPYYLANQTTLSLDYVSRLENYALNKLNDVVISNDICNTTKMRQSSITKAKELVIVVGDKTSSNSNRLAEIAKENNQNSFFIETINDLAGIDLEKYKEVYITSGASTPDAITNEVICYLENYPKKKAISNLTDDDYLKY